MTKYRIIVQDCVEAMRAMPENSVDAIVTDPPYGLEFMGKDWDKLDGAGTLVEAADAGGFQDGAGGNPYSRGRVRHGKEASGARMLEWHRAWATEALRVLKPGGHALVFGGSRTYHTMAMGLELAGFEIRDQIQWVYGSGFPKSMDVGKAIDKCNGDGGRLHKFTAWMRTTGITAKQINEVTGTCMGSHYLTDKSQPAIPTSALWQKLRPLCGDVPEWVDELVERIEAERAVVGSAVVPQGHAFAGEVYGGDSASVEVPITAPATDAARQWDGWGTALKPAHEPIVVARKPLIGTVAANVLAHGTGAINIDGCRVPSEGGRHREGEASQDRRYTERGATNFAATPGPRGGDPDGRWPANFIHDGSDEVLQCFPESKDGMAVRSRSGGKNFGSEAAKPALPDLGYGGSGSAARFFYCAKVSKAERNAGLGEEFEVQQTTGGGGLNDEVLGGKFGSIKAPSKNHHPTVKPVALMAYLCRLVTPPGGTVLDPFAGSGSTGVAALREGFGFIGIEREAEYAAIAEARVKGTTT